MKKASTICIIDDDSIYTYALKYLINFSKLFSEIIEYPNGRDAFYAFEKQIKEGATLPDVILLDINMPIWNGWHFLEELEKSQYHHLNVYIMTSSINSYDKNKAKSFSFIKGFFEKPLGEDDLKKLS
ncbi:MAG: response regulator, partial [Chitinophagaceae bacterium]